VLKSSKFVMGVLGLIVVSLTAITKTMDANVMACVVAIVGGFMGANAVITNKALNEGVTDPTAPREPPSASAG